MIVVAIIGILAAIAIPQYQNYVARTQVAEAFSLMSGAKTAVAEYFITNGDFPANNKAAGLPENPGDINGNFVEAVYVQQLHPLADGSKTAGITALFSADAHPDLRGATVEVTAVDNGGSILFTCTSGGEDREINSYLPSFCDKAVGAGSGF